MTELCRLCGDFKLTGPTAGSLTIDEPTIKCQLEAHLKIVLDPDKLLPHLVCTSCAETLDKCVRFTTRVLEVQERLKNELLEQLSDFPCEDFQTFELKIERLDVTDDGKAPPKKSQKKPTTKRNRGLKMTREVVKYTMADLFSSELNGQFTAEPEQMPTGLTDTLGWFNCEWKCSGCSSLFANVIDLERHSIKCTRKRCVNHCRACLKDFPSYSTYLNHIVERHEQRLKFSCVICSEFRASMVELYRHVVEAHGEHQNIFFCLYCGKYYFTGALLRDHLIIHRPNAILPDFTCDICAFTTVKKQVLLSHMSRFHLERRFTCECCAFSFKYRAELVQHQQSQHSDECNEECKACGKRFKNRRKLRRHVKSMHEASAVVFTCEQCGKVSKNRKSHVIHMRVHSDKDTYQCSYCPRTFKHSSGFTYHVRTHTGERPYLCPICDQKFIDWPNCKKHIKSSHGEVDIKPVQLVDKS